MGSKTGEKIGNALKATNDFLLTHKDDFDKVVTGTRIVYDAAMKIAAKKKKAVGSVLTGDPVADKAILEAEGVAGILKSKGIDYDVVLSLLYKVLELGATFLAKK